MITAYIFSRNRPCQADLLMRSLAEYLPGVFEPYLRWKADTEEFRHGYERLYRRMRDNELPAGNFAVERYGPRQDMIDACEYAESTSGLIALFTDDCVAWRNTNIRPGDIESVMTLDRVMCASLRLGKNTVVQDYLAGRLQPPLESADPFRVTPDALDGEEWLAWGYEKFSWTDNFGYLGAMDATVYRAGDLLSTLTEFSGMRAYRDWEGAMHLPKQRAKWAARRPLFACPETSCVVNVPCNSVQVDPTISGAVHGYSPELLNERYLAGEQLSLKQIPFGDVRSCHAEFPLSFEKQ